MPLAVVIGATAIFPPGETRIGSTSMTPFTFATFARYASIAARFLVMSAKTIWPSSPWRCGKSRFSVS